MLKNVLQSKGWNPNGKLLGHIVPFAGDGGFHKGIAYNYTNPLVIKAKFDAMQWAGVDGVIITWQGSTKPVNQAATLEVMSQCERRNMVFALLADPNLYRTWQSRGYASPEACVITELTNADGTVLLNSPAYLPEGYFLQFDSGFNAAAVAAAIRPNHPTFNVLPIHSGFSWINSLSNYAAVLADIKAQHANPGMKIPCVFYGFNDAGSVNPALAFAGANRMDAGGLEMNTQSWSGDASPSRVLFPRSGKTFWDVFATVPPNADYLALCTVDDPNEGTDFETMFSIFSGIQIG